MAERSVQITAGLLAMAVAVAASPSVAQAAPEDAAAETSAEAPADAATTAAEAPAAEPSEAETPAEPAPAEPPEADLDTEKAADAYRKGSDAYELGKFAEAAEFFGTAWELSHKAPLLYNLGQAHWKWFDTDPEIEHLRQARLFFTNYDKRMRLSQGYDPAEVQGYLETIEKQIAEQEKKIEEANRPVIIQSAALTEEEVQREHRRKTTRALNISGNVLIAVGAVTLGAGIGGLASRAVYGAVLDNTTGRGEAEVNLATAEEDARRRNGYQVSGQVAFGTLIAAVVILPVGITLRAIGARRLKVDGAQADGKDKRKRKRGGKTQARAKVVPGVTGLRVHF